jgi:ubiquinone/menaquinone biosynthesis C-methylase UbiE
MANLYEPCDSILGQILQQEIHTKQLVNEHALIPINDYLKNYIFPEFSSKKIQTYLDIAAGTGVLSAQIADILRSKGHPATMFTLDLFNKVAEPNYHIQANGLQLPFRRHSFDFVTMNFGFRYFVTMPQNQAANIATSSFEKTATNYGLDKEAILYSQFMNKAFFLHDILYRVLKPSGRLMLMISTESPDTTINLWPSCFSMITDCFRAETSPWKAIRRFYRIANPTSIAFFKALYQQDVVTKHIENHFFNSCTVTQALLQHFQGEVILDQSSICSGILEFTAPSETQSPSVSIQESVDRTETEYALPI